MNDLLDDVTNLEILKNVCSGSGVFVNMTWLSRHFKRHRNTVQKRVDDLIRNKIINPPVCPFVALYKAYPLLIVVFANFPDYSEVEKWLKTDKNIFAAFKIRDGDHNIMLFEFHKTVLDYQIWRDSLVKDGKIPPRQNRLASQRMYFSNELILKYEPNAPIRLMEEQFAKNNSLTINGYTLDKLAFKILKCLLEGKGVKVNENHLSHVLGIHRNTVGKRLRRLLRSEAILPPVCRFPNFFVPPNFLFVFSLVEIRDDYTKIISDIKKDPHVSFAFKISEGKFNLLLFSSHFDIEEFLTWDQRYRNRYADTIGAAEVHYLSPRMTVSIDQQKVSLGVINDRLSCL